MASDEDQNIGRTIQLYLVDGTPDGLSIATIYGWTGSIIVARNSTLPQLMKLPEANRTGIYLLYGPDPENELKERIYVGEADNIKERLPNSARDRGFWEIAAVITTSDESLTKAHVRYLEAELIQLVAKADRVALDNYQPPETDRRYLPKADKANMAGLLKNIETILPVIGMTILNSTFDRAATSADEAPTFVLTSKNGANADMREEHGNFLVLKGSYANKDTGNKSGKRNQLHQTLIEQKILVEEGELYRFNESYLFNSPSAAAGTILDRSANGRTEWKHKETKQTYDEWQSEQMEANT